MPSFFRAIFGAAIALCPPGFRREYGAAMREDFAHAIAAEHTLHGWFGTIAYGCEAIVDLLTTALREYAAMFFRDFVYAFRALRKTPSFSAIVILTLALAIGANAAVFSILHAVVLEPLPYAQPERLVSLDAHLVQLGARPWVFALPEFAELVRETPEIGSAAAFTHVSATLTGRGAPRKLDGEEATPGLFTTLGVAPLLGRFAQASDAARGAAKTVVISEAVYRRDFGANPRAVGLFAVLNGDSYRIIGVAPASFAQPSPGVGFNPVDYWTVLPMDGAGTEYDRGYHAFNVVARLAPGASLAATQTTVASVIAGIVARHPADDTGFSVSVSTLTDSLVGNVRTVLFALFAAVAGVLLVACANVANLLLSRAASREREFSVRIAIGASRGRIIAQLLVETFVLAVVGGVIGIGFAYLGIAAFVASNPPNIPRANLVSVDGAAILYTFCVVTFCTLAAGLAPAFTSSHRDVALALKSAGRGGDASRGARARSILVATEIAMTLALVIAAGLVVRSFLSLATQPLGFDARDVRIVGVVNLPDRRYTTIQSQNAFYARALARIERLPGVVDASWADSIPFSTNRIGTTFELRGQHYAPGHNPDATLAPIDPGYFNVLRTAQRAGRLFTENDRMSSEPVAIVNETFVRNFFGGRTPLGAFVTPDISTGPGSAPARRIVGVVADVRERFNRAADSEIYVPMAQVPFDSAWLVVRSQPGVDPSSAVASVISSMDPLLPKPATVSMESRLATSVAVQRLTVAALVTLALVALALSIAGVFAVVSYGVTQRTHEFGVRMALGADARQIIRMVVSGAMRLAVLGIVCGLLVAAAATRLLTDQLYETQPLDPLTFGTVTVLVLAAALVAALVPARRATRVDPIVALRYE
jgi:putative ABC transport system permease protein